MLKLSFKEPYSIVDTFECGQIFRFRPADTPDIYYGPLEDRIIKIRQKDTNTLEITSNNEKGLDKLVNHFFRVEDNYNEMVRAISIDELMKKIVNASQGLHLVLQNPFECNISYILSQCSNIKRIRGNLEQLSARFGKSVLFDSRQFYLFPTRDALINVDEQTYRDMGFGYRAEYLEKFIKNYPNFLTHFSCSSDEFNQKLIDIRGVGQKVADCIQLFAYGDLDLFPIDTWMAKFMKKYYAKTEKISNKRLRELGQQLFGKWAGYAQEFIFNYARNHDISLDNKKIKKSKKNSKKKSMKKSKKSRNVVNTSK
jgi:N-glycosylase/DNA lyase